MKKPTIRKSMIFADRTWFLTVRLGFAFFIFLTSLYCLLSYIPFTYHWVIKGELISWLDTFVKFHTYIYCTLFLMVITTLLKTFCCKRTRFLSFGFVLCNTFFGILLFVRPLLPSLENNQRSLTWSLLVVTPLLCLSLIDYLSKKPIKENRHETTKTNNLRFSTAFLCSVFVSVLYSLILVLQNSESANIKLNFEELSLATFWSFITHLLIFSVAVALLRIIRASSKISSNKTKTEFILCNLTLVLIIAAICRYTIFQRISFTEYRAIFFSLFFAFAIVFFLSSLNIKLARTRTLRTSSGLELALKLIIPGDKNSFLTRTLWLGSISFIAYFVPHYFATADWDFLLQTLSVFLIWFLSFGFFLSMPMIKFNRPLMPVRIFVLATILGLGFYQTLGMAQQFSENLSIASTELSDITARYAEQNRSFQVARDMLSRPLGVIAPIPDAQAGFESIEASEEGKKNFFADRSDASFYNLLKQNTGLSPSVKIEPVDIKLGEKSKPLAGEKPNIIIFVVDSLRQDYLSPYNKSVSYTPSIESFAKESVVFQNSFTRYGGTVLSEPALWSGAMIPHKQYIEPFYSLNSLQKLIDTENYEQLITMDPVLEIIMRPSNAITKLDTDKKTWTEYDLCQSVQEIQDKIDERQTNERPLFVYTQPQNLHLRRLEAISKNNNKSHDGFEKIYADEVKRFDKCFGSFVQYLKVKEVYDNSIIIITSDHGDSLGEERRWGHSYWMFPEIVRIPLIVHLPSDMQKIYEFNNRDVAFSLDITPSLYYLLGYRPIAKNPLFGRPLFTETLKEYDSYLQEKYLLVSSYGAVYAVLSKNGRNLFIADGVNEQNYSFDLEEGGKFTPKRIANNERTMYESFINKQIDEINKFYNFTP